jgi:HSP20 family protein
MEILHRQMDRIFDEMLGLNHEITTNWVPSIELKDTNENLILRTEIPGVEGKDLEVRVARQAISISGQTQYEHEAEERGYWRSELRYGKFQRLIPLPVPVKNEDVKAEFKNGILTLILPKIDEVKYKVVKIDLANDDKQLPGTVSAEIVDVPVQKA